MRMDRVERQLLPFLKVNGAEGFQTVAVVRHPVSWLGSWYRYRQRDGMKQPQNATRGISFADFVAAYAGDPPPFADVGSQAGFLTGATGTVGATHLFRYEAQERLLAFLADRLGPIPALRRLNVSPAATLELPPGALAALRAARPADFDLWERASA
jgi:hypothetical protein